MSVEANADSDRVVLPHANEEYLHLAVKITSEPDYGRWVGTTLHQRCAALFQDESIVTAHVDFLRQAVVSVRAANG